MCATRIGYERAWVFGLHKVAEETTGGLVGDYEAWYGIDDMYEP